MLAVVMNAVYVTDFITGSTLTSLGFKMAIVVLSAIEMVVNKSLLQAGAFF